jgi:predicted GNAT family acetyltransferase
MTAPNFKIDFLTSPAETLSAAEHVFCSDPVELNLLSTILTNMTENGKYGRFWIVRDETSAIVGMALQAPETRPMNITKMPSEAATQLADFIHAQDFKLPGVGGAVKASPKFAGRWTELTNSGAMPSKALRIYEQKDYDWTQPVKGRLIRFTEQNIDLAIRWMLEFCKEIGEPLDDVEEFTRFRVSKGLMCFWENDEPRCLLGHTAPLNGVVRIQAAYTPKEARGSGYATNAVGTLSDQLAKDGLRRILYTDLENPTSNKIYRNLGYEAVSETLIYKF